MTNTTATQITKVPELDIFARELKEAGFTVIASKGYSDLPTWLHFFKDGKMGYVQKSYFHGFDFSTTHKPCKDFGTGFSVLQETELSLENANKALRQPTQWAGRKRGQTTENIKYYFSPEDFINSPMNKGGEYYTL